MSILELSDIISIFGILANIVLVYWLTTTIQNRVNNSRVLKDFFIDEIKILKNDFELYVLGLLEDNFLPKNINSNFNNFNIKFSNLIKHLNPKYKILENYFNDFSYNLHSIVENDTNYINSFKNNNQFQLTTETKNAIENYKSEHLVIFYNLIVEINDYEKK